MPNNPSNPNNDQQTEIHNKIVGDIVRSIVKPPLDAGGSYTDVMVVLESVVVGVVLMGVRLGGDEKVLDAMMAAAKIRLAEMRLKDIETKGKA